jgi:hypothetical protein
VLRVSELMREDVVASIGAIAKTPDDRDLVLQAADSYRFG